MTTRGAQQLDETQVPITHEPVALLAVAVALAVAPRLGDVAATCQLRAVPDRHCPTSFMHDALAVSALAATSRQVTS